MSKKPSSDYDPMSYGEIRLEGTSRAGSPGNDPEEILFDDAPPAKPSTTFGDVANAFTDRDFPPADSVDRNEERPTSGQPGKEEGEEVVSGSPLLTGPETAPDKPPAPQGAPASEPAAKDVKDAKEKDEKGAKEKTQRRKPRPASRSTRPRMHPRRMPMPVPMPSRGRRLSLPLALAVFTAGLGGGAYFHLLYENPVLGGVSAAMGLVGALFALILLRR